MRSFLSAVALLWTARALSVSSNNQRNIKPWSRIATVNEDGFISCNDCKTMTHDERSFDMESPREWMEYIEATEGQGGAYTVLRCDFQNNHTRIWGRDFHMKRLGQSYCTLCRDNVVNEKQLDSATKTTNAILNALEKQVLLTLTPVTSGDDTFTIMLTILWQTSTESPYSVLVRGHAFCNGKSVSPSEQVLFDPIIASLAINSGDEELPNRYNPFPEAKLSCWCRQRRPLEQEFKVNGAGEVLLTRNVGGETHILEGLTSNVFFVYPGEKLRTASHGVLKGYARELVLECAPKLGLDYDASPIRVQDASLWKEVFLTSSIRLVVPVRQILCPDKQGEYHSQWNVDRDNKKFPICRQLYQELLKDNWPLAT